MVDSQSVVVVHADVPVGESIALLLRMKGFVATATSTMEHLELVFRPARLAQNVARDPVRNRPRTDEEDETQMPGLETKMKALVRHAAAAALMTALAAAGSAQTSRAASEPEATGGKTPEPGADKRSAGPATSTKNGDRKRLPGAAPANHSASAPFGTVPDNRTTGVPSDEGMTRGGPENPSGLKKPD
jgi:hypothetical protein